MKIEEIKSWNDLTLYLTSTNLSENSLLDIINAEAIKTDSFKKYSIHIKGDTYNSTINANYATAIVDFQKNFDSLIGRLQKKGHKRQYLVSFQIKKGSSDYLSENIEKILEKFITEAFPKMNSDQVFYLCVILMGILAGCYLIPTCIKQFLNFYHKKGKQKTDLALLGITEKLTDLLSDKKVEKVLSEAEKCGENCKNSFLMNTPVNTVDSIEINGKTYSRADVIQYQKPQTEEPTVNYLITDEFEICTLKLNDPKSFKVTVKFANSNKAKNSFDLIGSSKDNEKNSYLDSYEIQSICNAISKNKKRIKLTANIEFNKDVPIGGTIMQVFNSELSD